MRKSGLLLASLAALSLGACVIESNNDATLLVVNDSDYVIEAIHLVPFDSPSWGRNLLAGDVLFPGEDFLLAVRCDFYDALLIDEDGVECELQSLDLCLNDATWVIRNNTCRVFGRELPPPAEKPNADALDPAAASVSL